MKRRFQNSNDSKPFKKSKLHEFFNLPIYEHRKNILNDIKQYANLVIISTTGSGKTTQIPKFLLKDDINDSKIIGISQPRRIATISIATRVAEEMNCKLGEIVGYSVRFEYVYSDKTKLKFMTDGILLREAVTDPLLKSYSVIILDEVHERSLNNDILLGVVKNAQHQRRNNQMHPLKIIIMSATIDPIPFIKFLGEDVTKYISISTRANKLAIKCLKKDSQVSLSLKSNNVIFG